MILGGPGCGKLHYSEQVTDDMEGFVHINMGRVVNDVSSTYGKNIPK